MKRVILHWSAGGHKANATDKRHYHFIIEGGGTVVAGDHKPEANNPIRNPKDSKTYAAHTRGMNSGSIGIALAAMRGAKERPFDAGPSPITQAQVAAMVELTARLCQQYAIPVKRDTVLSHAEVETTLGVKQAGKWDIRWLPDMQAPGGAVEVGDRIRGLVVKQMAPKPVVVSETPSGERQGLLATLLSRIFSFLNKGGPA